MNIYNPAHDFIKLSLLRRKILKLLTRLCERRCCKAGIYLIGNFMDMKDPEFVKQDSIPK